MTAGGRKTPPEGSSSASAGALLVLSFRPESRGWLFWISRDAYSSRWMVMKSSSLVRRAFVPLIAEGLIIRSSLSDDALTRRTMRWSLGRAANDKAREIGWIGTPITHFPVKRRRT